MTASAGAAQDAPDGGPGGAPGRAEALEAEVLEVVRGAVVRVLEVDPARVQPGTLLVEDLRADSLALVEVVELVEEELAPRAPAGFHVDDDELERLRTVGEAVDLVLSLLRGPP